MSNGPYHVRATFNLPGIGTIELLERMAGYDTYHVRRQGDNRTHPPRITNRDARVLLGGIKNPVQVLSRYAKELG